MLFLSKKQKNDVKKYILLPLIVIFVVVGGFFAFDFYLKQQLAGERATYGFLKPEVSQTLNSRKFVKTSTSASLIRIEDHVLGAKVILPATIAKTDKGNDLLVLVNKKIQLPPNFVPRDLVSLEGIIPTVPGALLRTEAVSYLKELYLQAKSEGLSLTSVSAYRSYSQQVNVFNAWVTSAGLKNAENFSARAGHSQHQLGTAVDFGAGGSNSFNAAFGSTPEGTWLAKNAYKFGFVLSYPAGKEAITGYSYEPWHYRYIGLEAAQRMVDSGLILEEFLQKFGTW